MVEYCFDKKKGTSGVRAWKIKKDEVHQCCIVDFGKKSLRYNEDKFWIRFVTQKLLYIYPYPKPPEYTEKELLEMLEKVREKKK